MELDHFSSFSICPTCEGKFVNENVLNKHISVMHKKWAPFVCSYSNCQKKFHTQYRLQVHHLTHEGTRPFKCNLCDKAFYEKGTLKTHKLSHNVKNANQCELCNYSCKTFFHLREHYKVVHNNYKLYLCKFCGNKYLYKRDLSYHIKEEHLNCKENQLTKTMNFDDFQRKSTSGSNSDKSSSSYKSSNSGNPNSSLDNCVCNDEYLAESKSSSNSIIKCNDKNKKSNFCIVKVINFCCLSY